MKKLIILRGLPGSGKTHALGDTDQSVVCSADHYFEKNGEYEFDPTKLGEAHMECQLKALNLMAEGQPLVVIDNTNTRHWEYKLYERMGGLFGYSVEVREVGGRSYDDVRFYAKRNKHGVPALKILEMAYRWEEVA